MSFRRDSFSREKLVTRGLGLEVLQLPTSPTTPSFASNSSISTVHLPYGFETEIPMISPVDTEHLKSAFPFPLPQIATIYDSASPSDEYIHGLPFHMMKPMNPAASNQLSLVSPTPSVSTACEVASLNASDIDSPTSLKEVGLNRSNTFHAAPPSKTNKLRAVNIPPCPNMVNHKCRCKQLLRQNIPAQKVWSSCYRTNIFNEFQWLDDRELNVAFCDALYTKLCDYFQSKVGSNRVPTKSHLTDAIKMFGGFTATNDDLLIDRCNFVSFWRWFRGAVAIIKDLRSVWDNTSPFQMNLFMDRGTCRSLLEGAPKGTFILRLSQATNNGLVLSYSETTFNRATQIRNLLLIRKSEQNYVTKTNRNSQRALTLNQLIRTFVKLKFVYTPKYIYKKNQVF